MSTRMGDPTRILPGAGREPRRAFVLLLQASAVVIALHLAAGVTLQLTGTDWAEAVYRVFNVNQEGNVPTFFSAALWLVAVGVVWQLSLASSAEPRTRRAWRVIGVICVLIAVDESLRLHERLIEPMRELLDADGILYFAWVVPYAVLVVAVVLLLGRFVWRLGAPVNRLILLAGAIFVTGALGMELAEGYIASGLSEEETTTPTFIALYTIEETLELIGVSLFIYALLRQRVAVEESAGTLTAS